MIWALVAARLGAETKKRLEPILPPERRRAFAQAMLEDVLAALHKCPRLEGIALLAGDAQAASIAGKYGALVLRDEANGLNPAIARGIQQLRERGATGVLIAMGDLPLLQTEEVNTLLAALPSHGAVAAPSRDGTGTNLLALRPGDLMTTHFGAHSLAAHRRNAAAKKLAWHEIDVESAALDVDTPEDLLLLEEELHQLETGARATREWLHGQ